MRPAGAGQGPPVLRGQPAQPARDADVRRGRQPEPTRCGATWLTSSGGCARRSASASRTCGCRSGIRAGMASTPTSRSAAGSPRATSSGPGVAASRPHQAARRPAGRIGHARRGAARGALPGEVRRQGPRRPGGTAGLHRYEVAQGFQPRSVPSTATTADEVIGWAESHGRSAGARLAFARGGGVGRAAGGVGVMGVSAGSARIARAWVERTWAAQGLPVKVRTEW